MLTEAELLTMYMMRDTQPLDWDIRDYLNCGYIECCTVAKTNLQIQIHYVLLQAVRDCVAENQNDFRYKVTD